MRLPRNGLVQASLFLSDEGCQSLPSCFSSHSPGGMFCAISARFGRRCYCCLRHFRCVLSAHLSEALCLGSSLNLLICQVANDGPWVWLHKIIHPLLTRWVELI